VFIKKPNGVVTFDGTFTSRRAALKEVNRIGELNPTLRVLIVGRFAN
jgi:hypothetical protein